MYICSECEGVFEEPETYEEHHPYGMGTASETWYVCPYCQSTNTKKITNLSKAGSVAIFGVFAIGKTTKEWHCNNCKSDF